MPFYKDIDAYKSLVPHLPRWFPADRSASQANPVPPQTFEIALTLAGAVSGGAYAAGFMDFFFQALDEWHAQRGQADIPTHNVRLKTMTGASAGGINAALAACAATRRFAHGDSADPSLKRSLESNPFYQTWVRQIDIRRLLQATDLKDGVRLKSLLDSASLDVIKNRILHFFEHAPEHPELAKVRAWCGDSYSVHFTLSNLCGVPYDFAFGGGVGGHLMRLQKDHQSYAVPVVSAVRDCAYPPDHLVLPSDIRGPEWQHLLNVAIASGTFPAALSARVIKRPCADYDWRFVNCEATDYHFAEPRWDFDGKSRADTYSFLAVDGGVMDNEPFELAHRQLAGLTGRNPRGAKDANRAVIMVDPFPELPLVGPDSGRPMVETLLALATGLRNQARFKAQDLALAGHDEIHSRFLVIPRRPNRLGKHEFTAAGLGGFLGFLDEAYRHHDFFLGRLNAYKFLRDWFVLHKDHPLFDPMTPAMKNTFASKVDPDFVQIIPLAGSAGVDRHNTNYLPEWPRNAVSAHKLREIESLLEQRVDAVLPLLTDEVRQASGGVVAGGAVGTLLWITRFWQKKKIMKVAMDSIRAAVEEIRQG